MDIGWPLPVAQEGPRGKPGSGVKLCVGSRSDRWRAVPIGALVAPVGGPVPPKLKEIVRRHGPLYIELLSPQRLRPPVIVWRNQWTPEV